MPDKGSYQLLIEVKTEMSLKIGALGVFTFPKGFYTYSGSAMNNLTKRIQRHCTKDKKLRWHIDYLTSADNVAIIETLSVKSENNIECRLNQELEIQGGLPIIPKFGSSDCNKCKSHLLYFGGLRPKLSGV
jgi:sugar fermentation stimulation protein A